MVRLNCKGGEYAIDWIENLIASILTIATVAYLRAKTKKAKAESKKAESDARKSDLEAQKLQLEIEKMRLENMKSKEEE